MLHLGLRKELDFNLKKPIDLEAEMKVTVTTAFIIVT